MDEFFAVVKPKLDNLVKFLDTELTKEKEKGNPNVDDEVIAAAKQKYNKLMEDPVMLCMVVQQLYKHFDFQTAKVNREGVREEVEKAKREAFRVMSAQSDFDPVHFQKCIAFKLPQHIDERVFMYFDMLCDYARVYGIINL
jgi:hypothetical protein